MTDKLTVRWAEVLRLARQALASLERRKDEDVNEWARRIANDVSKAND